jgi:hypothetical protein
MAVGVVPDGARGEKRLAVIESAFAMPPLTAMDRAKPNTEATRHIFI